MTCLTLIKLTELSGIREVTSARCPSVWWFGYTATNLLLIITLEIAWAANQNKITSSQCMFPGSCCFCGRGPGIPLCFWIGVLESSTSLCWTNVCMDFPVLEPLGNSRIKFLCYACEVLWSNSKQVYCCLALASGMQLRAGMVNEHALSFQSQGL